jgi:hypothetical protein
MFVKGMGELWEWGTKKPVGLAPCGLLRLHRMTLVITDGEFWWAGVPVLLIIVY